MKHIEYEIPAWVNELSQEIHSISVTKQLNMRTFHAEPHCDGWYCPCCGEKLDRLGGHFHEVSPPDISGTIETYEKLPDDFRALTAQFTIDGQYRAVFNHFVITSSGRTVSPGRRIVSISTRKPTFIYEFMAFGGMVEQLCDIPGNAETGGGL